MTTSSRTQYRIDPNLKTNAENILIQLGIKPAQAITMFYTEIERTGTFPFSLTKVPTKELTQEMKKVNQGIGIENYQSKSELFESLGK